MEFDWILVKKREGSEWSPLTFLDQNLSGGLLP